MKFPVDKKRKPIPFHKLIRVPLVCLGTGIVNYIVSRAAASLAQAGRISADSVFAIGSFAAAVLFVLSGLLFLRKLRQDEIIRSAGYVVLYYFILFVVAQEFAVRAQALPEWLFVPVWPFTYLHAGLLKVGFSNMFALAPALLSPLFYAMFGLPRVVEEEAVAPKAEVAEVEAPEKPEEPQEELKRDE